MPVSVMRSHEQRSMVWEGDNPVKQRRFILGAGGIIAGAALAIFAVASAGAQTPTDTTAATGTAVTTGTAVATGTAAATTTTPTGAGALTTTPVATATPGGAVQGSQSLPSTGTGPDAGGSGSGFIWLLAGGMLLAVAGGALIVASRRR